MHTLNPHRPFLGTRINDGLRHHYFFGGDSQSTGASMAMTSRDQAHFRVAFFHGTGPEVVCTLRQSGKGQVQIKSPFDYSSQPLSNTPSSRVLPSDTLFTPLRLTSSSVATAIESFHCPWLHYRDSLRPTRT
jgi:hypothetical protein